MSHEQPQIDDQVTETPQIPGLPSLKAQLKAKQEVFDSLLKQATKQMLQSCVNGSSFEDMRKFVQKTQENLVNMLVFKQQADEEACSLVNTAINKTIVVEEEKKLVLVENEKLREKHTDLFKKSEALEKKNRELTENFKNGVQCLRTELLEASKKDVKAANERHEKLETALKKCWKTCSGEEDEPASKKMKTEE
ncbi:hypothetical protein GCK72_007038 [Caenorhabditis remanei]|uniref:Uncharacterized protein n=1 Tax=Caenorhabditis remanei TaxID=31234 RepID=A0A6A5HGF2_CAERE|nr:hypothetical protein GCK72_007038 [Caenorhabditis remanei]KAF1767080.1 hypothetical protein GCK72_007038 [Caenorhabditis remanei]